MSLLVLVDVGDHHRVGSKFVPSFDSAAFSGGYRRAISLGVITSNRTCNWDYDRNSPMGCFAMAYQLRWLVGIQ